MHPVLFRSDESAAEQAMLPSAVRANMRWLHALMCEIADAPNKSAAIRNVAARVGHLPGCDEQSLRRKFYAWERAGRHPDVLVDRRKLQRTSPARAIGSVYKTYAESNQRVSREAWRQLMRDIAAGMEIAGLGTWIDLHRMLHPGVRVPERCPWSLEAPPPGMSYAHLQRMARLSPFEKRAARQGLGAAMDCVLPVLRTRVGLRPGQFYQFDDMWLDLVGIYPGQRRPIRPLEFACYDVHSGYKLAWGIRPRLERADGTKEGLKEVEFRMLLAFVLTEVGFDPEGVTLVVEHGTAAIREPLARLLSAFSGGAIRFERSGILGDQVHAGLFPGRGRGNFKVKALIESSHSLSHNVAAALPAQTGASPAMAPEQLAGLDAYCRDLVRLLAEFPPERREKLFSELLFPALHFPRLVSAVTEIYERMNDRTWHDLEGWEECGYAIEEFRLGAESNWFPREALSAMPANRRQAVIAVLEEHPECMRVRRLSPREVWGRSARSLRKLPRCHVPDILGAEAARRVRVQPNGTFAFEDVYLGPGRHIYHARIETPDGFVRSLRREAEYYVHVTPYKPETAWVTDPDSGALLGYAPRYDRAAYGDVHAAEILMGQQRRDLAEQAGPIRERHASSAQARAALLAHNEAVLSGAATTPEEKAEAARLAKCTGRIEDLIPPDAPPDDAPDAERESARADLDKMF